MREMPQNQRNPFIAGTVANCQSRDHAQMVRGFGNVHRAHGLARIPEMERTMISLKVLSAAAAIALVLPMTLPSESFAQGNPYAGGGGVRGGGAAVGGGGGGFRGGAAMGGGGARFSGGGGAVRGPVAGGWNGGVRGPAYAGGNWNGGYRRHYGGGGFYPGLVAGALVGGAIANSYAYGPGYGYAPGYYDDGYYDDGSTVAVVPGADDPASCAQRYRSYDPRSQTYLGYDGQRYPCP